MQRWGPASLLDVLKLRKPHQDAVRLFLKQQTREVLKGTVSIDGHHMMQCLHASLPLAETVVPCASVTVVLCDVPCKKLYYHTFKNMLCSSRSSQRQRLAGAECTDRVSAGMASWMPGS